MRMEIFENRSNLNMNDKEQKQAAKQFAEFWKDKGYEKG